MAPEPTIRVAIIDDHPAVRRGLRAFLELAEGLEVTGEAADGPAALELIASSRPDVVLLDMVLPGMDGVAVLHELRRRDLSTRVLIVTSFTDRTRLLPAVRAGARGYLSKDVDPNALVAAVRAVAAGHLLLEPSAADALTGPPSDEVLTAREREVLALIAEGRSNREIARALVVAEKTVKTHVSSILLKLGLSDRTQAALYAVGSSVLRRDVIGPGTPGQAGLGR